jgi:serine/threonine protein kinase
MHNPGDQIGPYRLVDQLGSGAFGVVWLAEKRTQIATTRAALKMPLQSQVDLDAIRREADVWVRASGHPNVMPILEADVFDGQVVIATEYAPDGSMENWLESYGGQSPTVAAAVDMTCGILAGLEHLHARSIIHRDLKPANILLQREVPRLADFGISRVLKTGDHSGIAAGTPWYMAPEAFESQRSEQTDVWAIGVILHQLLTGRVPFSQTDFASLVAAIVSPGPVPIDDTIAEPLRDVIRRSLERDPAARYGTAAEMRHALRRVAQTSDLDATIAGGPLLRDPLAEIRQRMLLSHSPWDLRENLYELEAYTASNPNNTEARMMMRQLEKAIDFHEPQTRYQVDYAPKVNAAPHAKSASPVRIWLGLCFVAIVLALVVYLFYRMF